MPFSVGLDSVLFSRRLIETPDQIFKAFLAVSVTTEDEDDLRNKYDQALHEIFKEKKIGRKKIVYKAAHLTQQVKEHASEITWALLDKISEAITHIDVYCAFYPVDKISIYGEASGQVIKRMTFLEKFQDGFHHVCAYQYLMNYHFEEPILKLDYFTSKVTPAWRELVKSNPQIEILFNGCECDPLISLSDLMLRLIQVHQHGDLTGRSLIDPIARNCPILRERRKISYHSMSKYLKITTPIVPLDINLTSFIKHPIWFIVWNPQAPRERVKPMFEWSSLYNEVVKRAYEEKGCFKFISPEEDQIFWDTEKDRLVAWSKPDEEMIEWMRQMDFEIPKVLKKEDIIKLK